MWKWNLPTTSQHHRQRQRPTNNLWRGANEKSNRMSVEGRAENRVSPAPSAGELPRKPLPATRTPPKPARERETAPPPTTTITLIASPAQTVDMRWNQRHPRLYHRRWNYFAVRLQPRPRQKKTAPAEPTPQPEPTPAPTAASDIPKQPPRKPWRGGGSTYQTTSTSARGNHRLLETDRQRETPLRQRYLRPHTPAAWKVRRDVIPDLRPSNQCPGRRKPTALPKDSRVPVGCPLLQAGHRQHAI